MDGEGALQFLDKTTVPKPLYLAISGQTMYAVLRQPFTDCADSGLVCFDIAPDGSLENETEIRSTLGEEGCHLCIFDGSVYVANYTSGSVVKIPDRLIRHYGSSIHPDRQSAPHPHFICPTPDKKYLCAADLGLDKLLIYDKTLTLISEASVPPESGARHIVFSSDGRFAYCVNELDSTVSVFRYHSGKLELLRTYSALKSPDGKSAAAAIRLNENRLYVSNRGDDSITCFKAAGEFLYRESITKCGGRSPRDFNIAGNILLCANEADNCVTQFKIAGENLISAGTKLKLEHPLCIIYRERSE